MGRKLSAETITGLNDMANKLRIHSVKTTSLAKSGHPTSCSSVAEIMSVLFFYTMKFSVQCPRHCSNDRFILSKGHAAPILYAVWAETGAFPTEELNNLRKLPYDLEGHPTPRLEFVDVATGSLGIGLSVAAGMAYVGKNIDKANYRVFCLLGDGECEEGSVWEAISFSSIYKLDNLCVIVDCNRLGQTQATPLAHNCAIFKARFEAFGFATVVVDGHSVQELAQAFDQAGSTKCKPFCIIAKTIKGKNFPGVEDALGWHGKVLGDKSQSTIKHLEGLIKSKDRKLKVNAVKNPTAPCVNLNQQCTCEAPSYKKGSVQSLQVSCGTALSKIIKSNPRIMVLDSDSSDTTFSDKVLQADPSKFLQCFIAEQNLIGVGIGMACRDRCIVFCTTDAAYLCRAHDQIRMGAISQTNINICGCHCGVSAGQDGPGNMALEDLAIFRVIPSCTIFYPSDAVSVERAMELAANTPGMCYIRISCSSTKVLYPNKEKFEVGKAKILQKSADDKCLIIAGGVTVHEALKAKTDLEKIGLKTRVMDLFTVKPLDKAGILQSAKDCKGRIVVVEDHYPEGGMGEAILTACSGKCDILIRKLAVNKIPRSGPPEELLKYYGISSTHIVECVKELLSCSCDTETMLKG